MEPASCLASKRSCQMLTRRKIAIRKSPHLHRSMGFCPLPFDPYRVCSPCLPRTKHGRCSCRHRPLLSQMWGRWAPAPPPPEPLWTSSVSRGIPALEGTSLAELSVGEAACLLALVVFLGCLRVLAVRASREALTSTRVRVLNMRALNRVTAFKEVFWGYCNAGMLEPLLTIAGSEEITSHQLLVNLFQLAGLFSWLYLVYDAFDISDVQQEFAYRKMDSSKVSWLRISGRKVRREAERGQLTGTISRDLALWCMLFGIFAAWAGVVSHREVVHSYAIVGLWLVLHHQSRAATAWGAGYAYTLLMPSAALMPLEYCLVLADAEKVDGLEALEEWRSFVSEAVGIDLAIEA